MHKTTKKQGKSPAKMHISLRVRTSAKVRKTLWYIIEKPKSNLAVQFWFNLAGDLGFEPRHTESESAVLPLHKSPMRELLYHREIHLSTYFLKNIFYYKID